MRNSGFDKEDTKLKQGLEALAAEVTVPDVNLAFEKHRRWRMQKNKYHNVVAASLIVLLVIALLPGPTQAFRGVIRVYINKMLTETSQLFQRSEESPGEIIAVDLESIQFTSLNELKNNEVAGLFIPSGLGEGEFESAEVYFTQSNEVFKAVFTLLHQEAYINFAYCILSNNQGTSGLILDIEDFGVEEKTIAGIDVATFSDDQGFTLLEWEADLYLFMMSGVIDLEQLLDFGLSIGVF